MKKNRHTPEQIVRKLREAEARLSLCRNFRTRGGKRAGDQRSRLPPLEKSLREHADTRAMKYLRELDPCENARLKKIVAEQAAVDISMYPQGGEPGNV